MPSTGPLCDQAGSLPGSLLRHFRGGAGWRRKSPPRQHRPMRVVPGRQFCAVKRPLESTTKPAALRRAAPLGTQRLWRSPERWIPGVRQSGATALYRAYARTVLIRLLEGGPGAVAFQLPGARAQPDRRDIAESWSGPPISPARRSLGMTIQVGVWSR